MINKTPDNDDVIETPESELPAGVAKRLQNGDKFLDIYVDKYSIPPREWDNVGIMACAGIDEHGIGDEKYDKDVLNKAVAHLPLWLYDHSGLFLTTDRDDIGMDQQGWDTSLIGCIYATKESVKKIFGNDKLTTEELKDILRTEVKTLTQYMNNDVYGFRTYSVNTCSMDHKHEVDDDSCGGFYSVDEAVDGSGFLSSEENIEPTPIPHV